MQEQQGFSDKGQRPVSSIQRMYAEIYISTTIFPLA